MNKKKLLRMSSRDRLFLILFAFSAIIFLSFTLVYHFWFLIAVVALPILLVKVCFKRYRSHTLPWLLIFVLYIPRYALGIYWESKVWRSGWEAFSFRTQPLIHEITQFERDHGAPPKKLSDLVPNYLSTVPDTGMRAYPEFDYFVGEESREQYHGNPWVLTVFTPTVGIGFDQIMYFPNQNYPKVGYGGWLERVGNWAYVHE